MPEYNLYDKDGKKIGVLKEKEEPRGSDESILSSLIGSLFGLALAIGGIFLLGFIIFKFLGFIYSLL